MSFSSVVTKPIVPKLYPLVNRLICFDIWGNWYFLVKTTTLRNVYVNLGLDVVTEAEASIVWLPDPKSRLIGKDPDAGKGWEQKEKGVTEGEIVSITDSMDMNLSKLWEIVGDRGAWFAAVHGVAKNWTWLWVSSGSWWCTGEPGLLQSMGLQRVGHDWATELNYVEAREVTRQIAKSITL